MKNKKVKQIDVSCPHHKGDGYNYEMSEGVVLWLCPSCNLNLAGEVAKQQAIETFLPVIKMNEEWGNSYTYGDNKCSNARNKRKV